MTKHPLSDEELISFKKRVMLTLLVVKVTQVEEMPEVQMWKREG